MGWSENSEREREREREIETERGSEIYRGDSLYSTSLTFTDHAIAKVLKLLVTCHQNFAILIQIATLQEI